MTYQEWAATLGANRWYKENGDSRTIYPLDYNWFPIFEDAIKQCDFYFQNRDIPEDVFSFTTEFIARVPTAWMEYKTLLEFFSGNLAGDTINPNEFHAGRIHKLVRDLSDGRTEAFGSRTDTQVGNTTTNGSQGVKERLSEYEQGVQGTNPTNENIGELGIDHASRVTDDVAQSEHDQTSQNQNTITQGKQDNKIDTIVHEEIAEENEVINYYDQLAFAKARMEMLGELKPFYSLFEDLFYDVESFTPWWKCDEYQPPFFPVPGIYIV